MIFWVQDFLAGVILGSAGRLEACLGGGSWRRKFYVLQPVWRCDFRFCSLFGGVILGSASRLEACRGCRPEIPKNLEVGGRRREVGGRRRKAGGRRREVGGQRREVGGQRREVGDRRRDIEEQEFGGGRQEM